MAQTAPAATPLAELDRIAGTAPPEMQPALARLRNLLSDRQSAQERQRAEVLENTARALLYQAETIRGFAFRYFTLHANWLEYLEKHQGTDTNAAKQKIDQRLDEYYQLLLFFLIISFAKARWLIDFIKFCLEILWFFDFADS